MGLLGSFIRFLLGQCCKLPTTGGDVAVSALAQDLYYFEITSQVPLGLGQHVVSSRNTQANWYRKLVVSWREAKPPPRTPEEAARLVIQTLKRHQRPDVEGLLAFYRLPLPHTLDSLSAEVPTLLPQGVEYAFMTLPVDAKAIQDGDSLTVYVSTEDPRESSFVPTNVQTAAIRRSEARAVRDYTKADALRQKIKDAGYGVLNIQKKEVLARKYRIRLRGIDAPEGEMPYGEEARQELVKLIQGKCLRVLIYEEDRYGRCVGDVYCNDVFVQEVMLKKGCAWHYAFYDQRPEFAKWEKQARAKRVGLWASSNPEKPWDWRKDKREGKGRTIELCLSLECANVVVSLVILVLLSISYLQDFILNIT